jgi:hypothetical protein
MERCVHPVRRKDEAECDVRLTGTVDTTGHWVFFKDPEVQWDVRKWLYAR